MATYMNKSNLILKSVFVESGYVLIVQMKLITLFLNPKTKHMSMLTVRRSDVDHNYTSPIENVQELIKEMNTDPNGLIVQVSNAEGTLETFHSPAVRGSKVSVRSELLRLQTLVD